MIIRPKHLSSIVILFILISILVICLQKTLNSFNIDPYILFIANTFLFLITIFSAYIQWRSIGHPNPNVFVRSVLSGMMIKMFAVVLAVLGYTIWSGDQFNKRAIFLSLFLYLVYLTTEVYTTFRLNKNYNA